MSKSIAAIPIERVEQAILLIRGEKVILDADLALLYGVSTTRLNEQVKRNSDRFPKDFAFRLTEGESGEFNLQVQQWNSFSLQRSEMFIVTAHPKDLAPLGAKPAGGTIG